MFETRTLVSREMVHWLLLWMLVAVVICALQARVAGNEPSRDQLSAIFEAASLGNSTVVPSLDLGQSDDHPYGPDLHPIRITDADINLANVLKLNANKDFDCVIEVWKRLDLQRGGESWKHVGMGAAYLRLNELDRATSSLQIALTIDPENALAEYFLGRVMRARARDLPFWYERNDKSPYRYAILNQNAPTDDGVPGRMYLPHFMGDKYAADAKRHFRRAIELSAKCDLEQTIRVEREIPRMELTTFRPDATDGITARQLLQSLGEEDYVAKAEHEVGIRVASGGIEMDAAVAINLPQRERKVAFS